VLAGHEVGSWAGNRKNLHRDPAGIHVGEARITEVGKFIAFGDLRPDKARPGKPPADDRTSGNAGDDARDGVVFFQGDDAHVVSPVHFGITGAWATY
jgi:hypothetical protein